MFLLCVEALSAMIAKAESNGSLTGVPTVTPSKLALANLTELLAITLDKPTCDSMRESPL
jgi:hypothetical protein